MTIRQVTADPSEPWTEHPYRGPGPAKAVIYIGYVQVPPYLRCLPHLVFQDETDVYGEDGQQGHYFSLREVDVKEKVRPISSFPSLLTPVTPILLSLPCSSYVCDFLQIPRPQAWAPPSRPLLSSRSCGALGTRAHGGSSAGKKKIVLHYTGTALH